MTRLAMCHRARARALRGMLGVLLVLLAGSPQITRACEVCREDKIAATYDWEVVAAAKQRGHTVVFAALRGPIRPDDASLARTLTRKIAAVPGIDAGTVRISLAPPAVSFACVPSRTPITSLTSAIDRALRPSPLSILIVQVGAPNVSASRATP